MAGGGAIGDQGGVAGGPAARRRLPLDHNAAVIEALEAVDLDLVAALAAGWPTEAVRRRGTERSPIVTALLDAEVAHRRGESTVAELVHLAERVGAQAPDVPLVRWWAGALVAESCGLMVDVAGARLATTVLAELPDDPVLPVLVLWLRGRLRRAAGLVELFGSEPDRAAHRRLCAQAIDDFTRVGFTEEVAVTRLLAAAGRALWLMEDHEENLAVALDARGMVGPGSVWAGLLDVVLATMAVAMGDVALADRVLDTVPGRSQPSLGIQAYGPVLRALRELVSGAGSPATGSALADAARQLSATDPLGGYRMRLVAAAALADLGKGAAARELALPVLDMPSLDPVDEHERDVLVLRLGIQAGDDIAVTSLTDAVDRFAALGHPGRAAAVAERLAEDLARADRSADAASLRAHQATVGRTRSGLPAGAQVAPAASVRVRVMAPVMTVEVDGRLCDLRTTAGRLLLALLTSHPTPLTVEAAADALWPNAGWDTERRRRLNVVVHRLRQGLGNAGAAVTRVGDALVLAAGRWDVDLFRLRRALRGASNDDLAGILPEVTGNLAHVQFPYDEQLLDERHALLAAVSRRLADDHGAADIEHAEVLRALGTPPI